MRWVAIIVLSAALALACAPAMAKSEKGQGSDNAQPAGPGGNGPHGQGNGHGAGPGNGPGGQGAGGGPKPKGPKAIDQIGVPDAQVLRAVESGKALPLAIVIEKAEAASAARVIDARLVTVDGFLLYCLTMLDQQGHSWRSYWYARSGNAALIR